MVIGSGAPVAIGVAKLLGMTEAIVAGSSAPEATGFDAGGWLAG